MTKEKKDRFKAIRNILEVIKLTSETFPYFKFYAVAAFGIPFVVFIVAAIATGWYAVFIPFALFGGILAFMVTLSRFAEKAGYQRVEGQPGASGAVLNNIKLASTLFEEEPITIDPKTYDLIFRGVGRAGVFLVTEGPSARVKKLLDKEIQRTKRILPNTPIHIIRCGNEQGQTPLKGLRKAIGKKKITLTKAEVLQIRNRLKSLGGMKLPIPKGMDPTKTPRASKRALRG